MSQFKKKLTALAAFLTLITLSSAVVHADGIAGNDVINKTDNVDVNIVDKTQNVNMTTTAGDGAVGQVDWGHLNVGAGETLRFGFSGLSQTIINRVLGGARSEIFGKILNGCTSGNCPAYQQTGKVVIINPAGILFGAGSQVDLNSLTATTFDFRGAKNLADLDSDAKANYLASLRQGEMTVNRIKKQEDGTYKSVPTKYNYNNSLVFDRNETANFNGITANHNIEVNGAEFNRLDSGKNTNNTVAMLSDNIVYKNSLIKVGDNLNYNGNESHGKVSLITADGASFGYLVNGAENTHSAYAKMGSAPEGAAAVTRNISIDNNAVDGAANVAAADRGIYGGSIAIENRAMTASGSDVNISNTIVRADKLESAENGSIYIIGTNKANIKDSLLSTKNMDNTKAVYGGEIYVNTLDDLNIENTHFRTAGANYPESVNAPNKSGIGNAGSVRLMSERGNTSVDNTIIASEGHLKVEGANSVTINNSAMEAKNVLNTNDLKDVDILSKGNINITNTKIAATNDVNVLASAKTVNNVITKDDLSTGGKISINSAYAEDATDTSNLTFIKADKNLNIKSKDTTVDNATLAYENISFYNEDNVQDLANVTIKNNTAFDPKGTSDIVLNTNGNFTFDHATSKLARGTEIIIGKDVDGTYGKLSAAAKVNDTDGYINADNVTVTSGGDFKVINESDITAKAGDITFTSGRTLTVDKSKLTANKKSEQYIKGYEQIEAPVYEDVMEDVYDDEGNPVYNEDGSIKQQPVYEADGVTIKQQIAKNPDGTDKTQLVDDTSRPIYDTRVIGGNINIATNGETGASIGNLNIINGSELKADTDVNLNARFDTTDPKGLTTIEGSKITAGKDINIKSRTDVTIQGNDTKDSHLLAGEKVNIGIQGGSTRVLITAKNNEEGNTIEAGKEININQGGNQRVVVIADNAKLETTGEDSVINITSDKDVLLGALPEGHTREFSVIDSSTSIISAKDINITSAKGSIKGEKAEIGTIKYGNELTFNAKVNNEFSSKTEKGSDGSFKAVNVNYIAGGENIFTTDGDIQFVDSTLNGKANTITAGNDVILNNLKIVKGTENAADTTTRIIANGDVTTLDVTNNAAEAMHSYPNDVSTDRSGATQTVLDVNGTKLFVTTKATPGDGDRADKGSVNLNLKGTSADAGVQIIAENNGGWDVEVNNDAKYNGKDENGVSYGPVVTISSADGSPIAVSSIITDKLTIVDGTDIIASEFVEPTDEMKAILGSDFTADVDKTKGYIQVRDRGGFNQNEDPLTDPTDFKYVNTYDTPVDDPDLEGLGWTKKHTISYGEDKDNFILIYDKASDCATVPPTNPDPTTPPVIDDKNNAELNANPVEFQKTTENHDLNRTALPRQMTNYSYMDAVSNGTGDKSGMYAAGLQASKDGGIEIVTTNKTEKEEINLDVPSEGESNND